MNNHKIRVIANPNKECRYECGCGNVDYQNNSTNRSSEKIYARAIGEGAYATWLWRCSKCNSSEHVPQFINE